MATESKGTAFAVTAAGQRNARSCATLADYWALTKPEVNLLILITTGAAFYLGYPVHGHRFPFALLLHTLLGTLLVASGTGTLNQLVEWRFDAQMRRTAWRPIPAGRLAPPAALRFGIFLALTGSIYLAAAVNMLASFLAVLTSISYLFLYTPLKRRTPLCTLVGALPGAMPPLIGWAAASGNLSLGAWTLYALLFLWQLPHFMAIAWMYREDYGRAGFLVLPRGEQRGRVVAWQSTLPAVVLAPISIIPTLRSGGGLIYPVLVLALSGIFLYFGAELAIRRSNVAARRLLLASILYLPFVFVLIMLAKPSLL
jgi:protoheme IX farnesyltransferase